MTGFMECDTCREKPGMPYLCQGCLNNRAEIGRLEGEIERLQAEVRRLKGFIASVDQDVTLCGVAFRRIDPADVSMLATTGEDG
jgi:hypothetical protein